MGELEDRKKIEQNMLFQKKHEIFYNCLREIPWQFSMSLENFKKNYNSEKSSK
jgi:hypothetical protein